MDNLVVSLISIFIGAAATVFASRHYYRRTVDKELIPFIQLQSNVLSRIDKEVKSDLHVEYKGVKVENLQQVQFLIANTGERAIKGVIKPLLLDIPDDCEIMDANILHISPEGREVALNIKESGCSIEFEFPLLNKDEFFIFKLLINGSPKKKDLNFSIVADDLPPMLNIKRLSYNQIENQDKKEGGRFEVGFFIGGIIFLLIAFFIGILSHYIDPAMFPKVKSESWIWINSIPFVSIASVVGYIITGLVTLIGGMMAFASFAGEFEFPKRKKFTLPKEFASTSYGFSRFEERMILSEEAANK